MEICYLCFVFIDNIYVSSYFYLSFNFKNMFFPVLKKNLFVFLLQLFFPFFHLSVKCTSKKFVCLLQFFYIKFCEGRNRDLIKSSPSAQKIAFVSVIFFFPIFKHTSQCMLKHVETSSTSSLKDFFDVC